MTKKIFDESTLILNDRKSVYHLDLTPEEIAPIIFLVGDPERVPRVSKHFDCVLVKKSKREFFTHTGKIGQTPLSVVSTGIGTDNIDIVINEIDALFNIDLNTRTIREKNTPLRFIRLGTAGGLQENVPIDSLIVSSGAIGMDGLLNHYADIEPSPVIDALLQHLGMGVQHAVKPYYAASDSKLLKQFGNIGLVGLTATNPGFYGPQGRSLRARTSNPDFVNKLSSFEFENQKIVNLEMETAAIYGLSALLGHQAISISVILANRASGSFSTDPNKAVEFMIKRVLESAFLG
jgi:uridine phosphorylase